MTRREEMKDISRNIFAARAKLIEAQRDINVFLDTKVKEKVMFALNECFNQIQLAFERTTFALRECRKAERFEEMEEKPPMKAYKITDREECCGATIVFAETRNKAREFAKHIDGFEDVRYTDIKAIRVPVLDQYYRGIPEMDWNNDEDRILMVKYVGFICSYECDPDCKNCPAKRWCSRNEDAECTEDTDR